MATARNVAAAGGVGERAGGHVNHEVVAGANSLNQSFFRFQRDQVTAVYTVAVEDPRGEFSDYRHHACRQLMQWGVFVLDPQPKFFPPTIILYGEINSSPAGSMERNVPFG